MLLEVSLDEPLDEDVLLLLRLAALQRAVVAAPPGIGDVEERIAVPVQDEGHEQPRHAPVPVRERMDRHEPEMDKRCQFDRMHQPLLPCVPPEEVVEQRRKLHRRRRHEPAAGDEHLVLPYLSRDVRFCRQEKLPVPGEDELERKLFLRLKHLAKQRIVRLGLLDVTHRLLPWRDPPLKQVRGLLERERRALYPLGVISEADGELLALLDAGGRRGQLQLAAIRRLYPVKARVPSLLVHLVEELLLDRLDVPGNLLAEVALPHLGLRALAEGMGEIIIGLIPYHFSPDCRHRESLPLHIYKYSHFMLFVRVRRGAGKPHRRHPERTPGIILFQLAGSRRLSR